MLFNYSNINEKESKLFDYLKLFLLLEVIFGHTIAIALPKLADIDINGISDILLVIYKLSFSFGRESAYLFVFLSGFFTAKHFFNTNKAFNFFQLLKKRIFRFYPILIIALLLTIVLDIIGIYIFHFNIYEINGLHYNVLDHYNLYILLANFCSLEPTFSDTLGSNGPLWTLGYLIQFFIFASLIRYFITDRFSFFIVSGIISAILGLLLNTEFFLLYSIWMIGLYIRITDFDFKIKISLSLILVFFFLLIIAKISNSSISIMITPFIGILLLVFLKKFPKKIFNITISDFPNIRDLSYSMYAFHMPIIFFIFGFYKDIYLNNLSFTTYSVFTIFTLFTTIIFSNFVQKILLKMRLL